MSKTLDTLGGDRSPGQWLAAEAKARGEALRECAWWRARYQVTVPVLLGLEGLAGEALRLLSPATPFASPGQLAALQAQFSILKGQLSEVLNAGGPCGVAGAEAAGDRQLGRAEGLPDTPAVAG